MIKVDINELLPGQRLARTIYSEDGQVLLAAGVELRSGVIARLKEKGFQFLYVGDERTADVEWQDLVRHEVRHRVARQVRRAFDRAMKGGTLDLSEVGESVDALIDEVLTNRHVVYSLDEVRSLDDYTFVHSVNVCVLSALIGTLCGLNAKDLRELAIGALLHDIGKVRVSAEVLNKRGRLQLDEMEEIKRHTRFGFDILRAYPDMSLHSAHVAYQHHERLNGKGYPRGLRGDEIHPYARIVMVVDTFDAMTANRTYRRAVPAHAALSLIGRMAGRQFPVDVVRLLQQHVAKFPVGCRVRLESGETGVVIDVNRRQSDRPIVRILEDSKGDPVFDFLEIDLAERPEVSIAEVL